MEELKINQYNQFLSTLKKDTISSAPRFTVFSLAGVIATRTLLTGGIFGFVVGETCFRLFKKVKT